MKNPLILSLLIPIGIFLFWGLIRWIDNNVLTIFIIIIFFGFIIWLVSGGGGDDSRGAGSVDR